MDATEDRQKQKLVASFAVLFAVALIAIGEIVFAHKNAVSVADTSMVTVATTAPVPSTVQQTSATTTPATASASQSGYKDGTYKATGSYISPAGEENIVVSVSLQNGVISSTSAQPDANDETSQEYQVDFIQNYKTQVVGKNISTLKLSRVSGSSLTPQGFNDAIAKIKSAAKA